MVKIDKSTLDKLIIHGIEAMNNELIDSLLPGFDSLIQDKLFEVIESVLEPYFGYPEYKGN